MNLLLPPRIDNTFRGHKLALVLFGVLVALKVVMSLNSIINGYSVATSADGIPLSTFSAPAARSYLVLFALFGLSQFMPCLLCLLVLVRYRALVPLMFALFFIEFVGRRLIFQFMPLERAATSVPGIINLVLVGLILVGLVLSLWNQRPPLAQSTQ